MIRKPWAYLAAILAVGFGAVGAHALTPIEQLGKNIFFDENLSANQNQSCAACHAPEVGWTGPDSAINAAGAVYEGSIAGEFGDRKPPAAAYAGDSPVLYQDAKGTWVGGMFWDGRATGWTLGDPLAEQALGPFLNPKEQALGSAADVVDWVCSEASGYWELFLDVWGDGACDDVDTAYDYVGFSIAAYERSTEVSPFNSRFDVGRKGKSDLSAEEWRGFALFQGKGKCAKCHVSKGKKPLFTDFTYDNLGVPKNPENPVYNWNSTGFVDLGLGKFLQSAGYEPAVYEPEYGKMKVPTLRNVDKRPYPGFVKAFSHNGFFKSLEGFVHFYNTRDVLPTCPGDYTEAQAIAADCWPPPEYAATVNMTELGDLGLSPEEEAAIVAFLKTLTDQ